MAQSLWTILLLEKGQVPPTPQPSLLTLRPEAHPEQIYLLPPADSFTIPDSQGYFRPWKQLIPWTLLPVRTTTKESPGIGNLTMMFKHLTQPKGILPLISARER
jgi:hypothetical protein